jgi:hypothetical protein
MTLCEELYFEITLTGTRPELKKFISFLRSGELDDFFEFSTEYINYDDTFNEVSDAEKTSIVLSTDDYGIEIDELDTDDGEHYIAIFPTANNSEEYIDSDGELIIMKIDKNDPDESFMHIEDEDEFNRVAAYFVERLSDEFDFLYPDEE